MQKPYVRVNAGVKTPAYQPALVLLSGCLGRVGVGMTTFLEAL